MMVLNSVAVILILSVAATLAAPTSRVVNGTDTTIEEYPYMVSLRSSSGSHSCGASIIAPKFILTAAHCVDGRSASSITIQYASTVISSKGPNVIPIKQVIQHEGYNPGNSYADDIALLELDGQLIFNYKTIAPIQLPAQNYEVDQLPEGVPGILTGWGLNATGGVIQTTLQEVHLKVYSDEECQLRHKNATSVDHICGGVDEGGMGQCSGDSGGPLVHNGVQVGIVSWSIKPCTVAPYPGVYTKVSHYIDWIRQKIY